MRRFFATAIYLFVSLSLLSASAYAQALPSDKSSYRKSSLYSLMVSHTEEKFAKEIEEEFLFIPIPDKFSEHDLSVKVITSSSKKAKESEIRNFLKRNHIANRLVGKWYDRNPKTGECNTNLISFRGLSSATYRDIQLAKATLRGTRALEDAGEELINNTFVVVNDIHYYDKNKGAQVGAATVKTVFAILSIFAALNGVNTKDIVDAGNNLGDIVASIKGFAVTVTSYLYRLEWSKEIADEFYTTQYVAEGETNNVKRDAFTSCKNYKLQYVGSTTVKADDVTMKGVSEYDLRSMIRKVCTRAIDKSLVALQKSYDEFKIKTPISSVSSSTLKAYVGMREGVTKDFSYEILEAIESSDGEITYKRVGIANPVPDMIWDNRYMSEAEDTEASKLEATTFVIKSSTSDITPGMLLREMPSKTSKM